MRKRPFTRDERVKGGLVNGERRRKAALAKLAGLSPMDIFKRGYEMGWRQGIKTARRMAA